MEGIARASTSKSPTPALAISIRLISFLFFSLLMAEELLTLVGATLWYRKNCGIFDLVGQLDFSQQVAQ